jgi:hypothetical protein
MLGISDVKKIELDAPTWHALLRNSKRAALVEMIAKMGNGNGGR